MSSYVRVKPSEDKKSGLTIHPAAANSLGIGRKKTVSVSFGCVRLFADVNFSDQVPESEIRLPAKSLAELHLPEYPEYEVAVQQNELVIGPCIGLLLSREDRRLTLSFLEHMKIYVKAYEQLHGAIIIFALDKVDTVGRLVEGYGYNPDSQQFEKGVFPIPSSIYRTIGLNSHWKNFFLTVLGDKVFNSRYFNKSDMYRWMSENSEIGSHIPFTKKYRVPQDAFELLELYNKVYIKPMAGLGGRGILRMQKCVGKYVFQYRENGVNQKDVIESREQAEEYLKEKLSSGRYLIQKAVNLIQYKGGVVDFRCIMQKDQFGKWQCMSIIGRCGERNSIVSNISSGGRAFRANEMIKKSLILPPEVLPHFKDSMCRLTMQICTVLDEYGLNCGTLGIDVGIDTENNLWLFEINNRDPDPTIALNIHDWQLYEQLKSGPMFYAKYLAGFPGASGVK